MPPAVLNAVCTTWAWCEGYAAETVDRSRTSRIASGGRAQMWRARTPTVRYVCAMSVVTREELEVALAELRTSTPDPRTGILGPRSVAWRLGGDLAVFVGGGRAALLQLAHPMVAYAIDHHSKTRADVLGRFQRTFRNVFAMIFGELDEAFVAARRVHQIHTRVTGTMPAIGDWPTRYAANDADALRWVHATLVDSVLVVRARLGAVAPADRDAYVIELNRFARLFGIPHALLPRDHAAHAAYMAQMLGRLVVTPSAREMAHFLVGRGGAVQPPLGRVTEAVTAELLPPALVAAFELRPSALPVRAGLATLAPLYRAMPRSLVAIPAHAEARRRLAGRGPSRLGAWTERQLFGLAQRATGS